MLVATICEGLSCFYLQKFIVFLSSALYDVACLVKRDVRVQKDEHKRRVDTDPYVLCLDSRTGNLGELFFSIPVKSAEFLWLSRLAVEKALPNSALFPSKELSLLSLDALDVSVAQLYPRNEGDSGNSRDVTDPSFLFDFVNSSPFKFLSVEGRYRSLFYPMMMLLDKKVKRAADKLEIDGVPKLGE